MVFTQMPKKLLQHLAASIHENNNVSGDFQQYLDTSAETRLKFNCITENETIKAINRLENKSSSRHDGISNKLLGWCMCQQQITLECPFNRSNNTHLISVIYVYIFG